MMFHCRGSWRFYEVGDIYYLAFDKVYDNIDIVNKLLELQEIVAKYPLQIKLLDVTCFEYIIFAFSKLIEWTGNGHKDVVEIREHILNAVDDHKINLDAITDERTLKYLKGFKYFSTERVMKSLTAMLTDSDAWSIKGDKMGACWYKDCCILEKMEKRQCNVGNMTGDEKIQSLLSDQETRRIIAMIK